MAAGVLGALVLHGLLALALGGRLPGVLASGVPAVVPGVLLRFAPAAAAAGGQGGAGPDAGGLGPAQGLGAGGPSVGAPLEAGEEAAQEAAQSLAEAPAMAPAGLAPEAGAGAEGGGALSQVMLASVGARIQNRVLRLWKNTAGSAKLRTAYLLHLDPQGRILSLRVELSSGDRAFDLSAERALLSAAPFSEVSLLAPAQYGEHFRELRMVFDSRRRVGL